MTKALTPLNEYQRELVESAIPDLHKSLRGDLSGYRSRFDSYDDMFQAAMLGVMRAAQKYDASTGYIFWTYAWWWARMAVCRMTKGQVDWLMVAAMPGGDDKYKYPLRKLKRTVNAKSADGELVPVIDLVGRPCHDRRAFEHREEVGVRMKRCTNRERFIVECHMEGMTLEEAGEMLGITRERVRQIYETAAAKMRGELVKGRKHGAPCQLLKR